MLATFSVSAEAGWLARGIARPLLLLQSPEVLYRVSPLTAWLVLHTTSSSTFHENFFLGRHRPCLPPCEIPIANQIQSHPILPWETNEVAGLSYRTWRRNCWQEHSDPKASTLEGLHQTRMMATCLSP